MICVLNDLKRKVQMKPSEKSHELGVEKKIEAQPDVW